MTTQDERDVQGSPLGRQTVYAAHYAPELLHSLPRQNKREELGVSAGSLPFVGEDVWNAHELSWLNPRGKPVVAVARFGVPADSPRLIESKSLKLYLNSFNQTRFANPVSVQDTVYADLSAACGSAVSVSMHTLSQRPMRPVGWPEGVLLDELDIDVDRYQPEPRLLQVATAGEMVSEQLYSHLLKSNCLVTGQPDWGTVVIRYAGARIDHEGLLRYIISFREHNEFHEQCVERIFCDILRRCRPQALAVWARYTRRGGLDINPFRSTGHFEAPENVAEIRQ